MKDSKERAKENKYPKTIHDESTRSKLAAKKESSSSTSKQEGSASAIKTVISDQKDRLSNNSSQTKVEKSSKTDNKRNEDRKSTSRPGTPSKSASNSTKYRIDSNSHNSSDRKSPSNLSHKSKNTFTENEPIKDSKSVIGSSGLTLNKSKSSEKHDGRIPTVKKELNTNKSRDAERDRERKKDNEKEKDRQRKEDKPKSTNSSRPSSDIISKKVNKDLHAPKDDKNKTEKKPPVEKELVVKLGDRKIKDEKTKINGNIKHRQDESEKKGAKDTIRKDNSPKEKAKRITDEAGLPANEKEKIKKEKDYTDIAAGESKEIGKLRKHENSKQNNKPTIADEKITPEQDRKTDSLKQFSEKKDTLPTRDTKHKEQSIKATKSVEENSVSEIKKKEQKVPKGMLIKNLLKAKTELPVSKPKLYDSADENIDTQQNSNHKSLVNELAISSEDDNQTLEAREPTNQKEVDKLASSEPRESNKKNKSSRKDKNKKKSKKREKDLLDERSDGSVKSKKKKRKDKDKEKEKKNHRKHKSIEDSKIHPYQGESDIIREVQKVSPSKTDIHGPLLSTNSKPLQKKCVFTR